MNNTFPIFKVSFIFLVKKMLNSRKVCYEFYLPTLMKHTCQVLFSPARSAVVLDFHCTAPGNREITTETTAAELVTKSQVSLEARLARRPWLLLNYIIFSNVSSEKNDTILNCVIETNGMS